MKNKSILLFSYYWPPAAGPGVQRWLKFCKFLGDFGFNVTVVTPEQPSASNYDETLLDEIPTNLKIVKTKSFEPFELYKMLKGKKKGDKAISVGGIDLFNDKSLKQRIFNFIRANFFIPDARKGWNSYALAAGKSLLNENHFDAVITTGPPHSTHLIGKKLKSQFGIPWIADFRDPWVNIYYNKLFPRTKRTKRKDQYLEDSVLKLADRVLVVSPGLKAEFENRAENIEIIYNGFDGEDIPDVSTGKNPKFRISYIGNFKPNQNCPVFWKKLKHFVEERKVNDLEVCLTGNVDQQIKSEISKNELDNFVVYDSYKPHREATQSMVNSDALLFIVPKTEHNNLILTGKLFEYLASGSEFISLGPPSGNAAEIIHDCGRGETMDYENEEAIYGRISQLYESWKSSLENKKLDRERVEKYSRKGMTKILAQTINEIIK